MGILMQVISSKIVQAAVLSWIAVNILKILIFSIRNKKLDFSVALKTGNMPSSHTAVIVGIASMMYLLEGFSNLFFFSALLAGFITYDSVTLRKQVGEHYFVINEMLKNKIFSKVREKYKIKKYLGHKISEVLVGIVVGIAVAVLIA